MAELQGTNYAKSIDPSSANIVDPGVLGGRVRVLEDTITLTSSTLKSSDYIVVGKQLPTGAQVLSVLLGFGDEPGSGTSGNLSVGDQGSSTRYLAVGQATNAAVRVGPDTVTGMNYAVTGTTDNIIRISASGSPTVLTGSTISIRVFYTAD